MEIEIPFDESQVFMSYPKMNRLGIKLISKFLNNFQTKKHCIEVRRATMMALTVIKTCTKEVPYLNS